MAFCAYCKHELLGSDCPNCGHVLSQAVGTLFYGANRFEKVSCAVTVTDRYLILRERPEPDALCGFYDLREFDSFIFPYLNTYLRDNNALKLILPDRTDLILVFDQSGAMGLRDAFDVASSLARSFVRVEDGSRSDYGNLFCTRPFSGKDNALFRVSGSAARFLSIQPPQYILGGSPAETPQKPDLRSLRHNQPAGL